VLALNVPPNELNTTRAPSNGSGAGAEGPRPRRGHARKFFAGEDDGTPSIYITVVARIIRESPNSPVGSSATYAILVTPSGGLPSRAFPAHGA